MRERFRYFDWFQSRGGATALLLVLMTGLVVGYYGWIALIDPPLSTYRVDFGNAQWIQPPQEANNVCFRKNINLSETPRYAWLQLTALDGFRLFINGKHAGFTTKLTEADPTILSLISGGNETIICDIAQYLVPGKNTIAVNATRSSFPGTVKLLCRGGIIEGGKSTEFVSDSSWKVSLVPGTIASLVTWTDPEMDDSSWAQAKVASFVERTEFTQPAPLPPVLLREPIKGKWIVDEQPGTGGNTTFQRHFDVLDQGSDGWLQVASNGAYSVILNDHFIGKFGDAVPTTQFLHLNRWLKAKDNDLLIQVRSLDTAPAVIAEISFLSDGTQGASVVSDNSWTLPNSRIATVVGSFNYSGDSWGLPPKMNVPAELSSAESMHREIWGICLMLAIAVAVFLAWGWWSRFVSDGNEWPRERSLGLDAALHLPAAVATATLLLLRYDVRLRPDAPINAGFFVGIIALLIVPRLLEFLTSGRDRAPRPAPEIPTDWRGWTNRYGFYLVLGLIVLGSLTVRLHNFTTFPLDQDDILIRNYAQGVFERGYPSLNFYGYVIPITTYELLPYPIALSCALFGWSDWAVVLPALVLGVLTTMLIGLMGRNLFDWRVGLMAALIHAFDPLNVFWAQHCFHPSQDQFFALLTMWSFYLAIRDPDKLHIKYFYGACFGFLFTYLSWEGLGFLLPIMAGALMLVHPGRWRWLREPHLWIGLIIVGSVVLIQLSFRKMVAPGFLFLGYGLAALGGPQAYFLNPESMPFFYLASILFTNPHLPLTLLCATGLLFVWGNRPLRYCLVIFFALLTAFSLCLPVYSIRYFYFYQFLLILSACAVFFILWDRARELVAGRWPAQVLAWSSGAVALLLVLGTVTETGLRVFRLSLRPDASLGYGRVRQDTRSPAEYVAAHLRPGDIVLANLTQAFYLYGHRMPDFALNTLLATRMIYLNDSGSYRHRFVGVPMVRNLRDVDQIFGQARRVWYIGGGPVTAGRPEIRDALDYVTQRAKIVFSTYHTKVFLWEGTVSLAQQTVINYALPPQPNLAPEQPEPLERIIDEADDSEPGQPVFNPPANTTRLYPQWTHQKVSERDPARSNAAPDVQPLLPPRKPEKSNSDEHP